MTIGNTILYVHYISAILTQENPKIMLLNRLLKTQAAY